ncbi:MAG TPA: DUF1428 domain-containing protein [Candidatus Binatia bacterium]|nr:DUF1428 domain-containing protein [Candidatus Binatia bacterium]
MTYVDGYLLPVKKKGLNTYRKMASGMAKLCKKYGALHYFECAGDDLHNKMAKIHFPKLIKAKPDETVIFAFVIYKSKASRNSIMKKIMSDPSMGPENWKDKPMPFDMNRMAFGGFKTIVEK